MWSRWETAVLAAFHGIHTPGAPFEFGLTDLAKRRMPAALVIEHLDVIEQGLLGVRVTR